MRSNAWAMKQGPTILSQACSTVQLTQSWIIARCGVQWVSTICDALKTMSLTPKLLQTLCWRSTTQLLTQLRLLHHIPEGVTTAAVQSDPHGRIHLHNAHTPAESLLPTSHPSSKPSTQVQWGTYLWLQIGLDSVIPTNVGSSQY